MAVEGVPQDGRAGRRAGHRARRAARDLALGDGTGRQRRIRIYGVERDPKDPAGEIVLYTPMAGANDRLRTGNARYVDDASSLT